MYVTLNLNIMAENDAHPIYEDRNEVSAIVRKLVPNDLLDDNVIRFAQEALHAIVLYAAKNHDYGNSFEDGMSLIGDAYGTGRLYDKAKRIATLTGKPGSARIGESMEDTALDLACYSLMYLSFKHKPQF